MWSNGLDHSQTRLNWGTFLDTGKVSLWHKILSSLTFRQRWAVVRISSWQCFFSIFVWCELTKLLSSNSFLFPLSKCKSWVLLCSRKKFQKAGYTSFTPPRNVHFFAVLHNSLLSKWCSHPQQWHCWAMAQLHWLVPFLLYTSVSLTVFPLQNRELGSCLWCVLEHLCQRHQISSRNKILVKHEQVISLYEYLKVSWLQVQADVATFFCSWACLD